MNSIYHSENIDELTNGDDLARTPKLMEDAGVFSEDPTAAAIQFFDAQKNNSGSKQGRCERSIADEELTVGDDPSTSDQQASISERHASRSDHDTSTSEQSSEQMRADPTRNPAA